MKGLHTYLVQQGRVIELFILQWLSLIVRPKGQDGTGWISRRDEARLVGQRGTALLLLLLCTQ